MPQFTPNMNLHKIELTDTPPDITVLNPNWDKLDEKLKEITDITALKPTVVNQTISANSWSGSGPWTYTLNNTAIKAQTPVYMTYQDNPGLEIIECVQAANIVHRSQTTGQLVIQAIGERPSIALPLVFIIGGGI